eukprot:CAMPEP_0198549026 /NCGR_PEP_ID=MMETSP1462-20131121/71659_1 /TAXON_ID=1333877 /ORGANISM="Brandtodinium nutriculum, Strain RCC3387" /LENGTH=35 /DNA_ID= /DNA_START= /DNA_END= /DNA_ORIENTATION=
MPLTADAAAVVPWYATGQLDLESHAGSSCRFSTDN